MYWLRFGVSLNCPDMRAANDAIVKALAKCGVKVGSMDENKVEANLNPSTDVAYWFWYRIPDAETMRRMGAFQVAHLEARKACPGISKVKPCAGVERDATSSDREPFKGPGSPLVEVLPCMDRVRQGVPEGMRDKALFWLAVGCLRDGKNKQEAIAIVQDAAARCEPPFLPSAARQKVESAYRRGKTNLQCRLDFLHEQPTLCSTNCRFYKPGIGLATDDGPYEKAQPQASQPNRVSFPWSGKLWANG
jgi:hypothetical protein